MSYRELYTRSQLFGPRVSRKRVYPEVLAITGFNQIRHAKSGMDTKICRGMYLSVNNMTSRLVQQIGSRVIVTARDLNYCWERFVYIKELMHAFDDPTEATDTGEGFDELLEELAGPTGTMASPQAISEVKCFWMALGVLCPEEQRRAYAVKKTANQLDDYAIALELRIPQAYVPRLFEDRFPKNIALLTAPPG